ncbi:hypothetical protein GCM10009737_37180 [Nocardioides lentus]|uniref:Nudix hydrolase domain-containing protein n=1 Tax=Nocardioides lentus TaxID=338077 RepID=A0ABP5B6E9_9ACTN
MARIDRDAARLLVVGPSGRVLLTEWHDPARPDDWHWIPPGGAVEAGESAVEAAVRETFEETGLVVDPTAVTGPVHTADEPFSFGGLDFLSHETYVAVALDAPADAVEEDVVVISLEGLQGPEIGNCRGAAWWYADDLDAAGTAHAEGLTTAMRAAVATVAGGPSGAGR